LYNRGNDKRFIFENDHDKKRFQELLYIANSTKPFVLRDLTENVYQIRRPDTLVDIGAYCLMFSHFHLLAHEKVEGGISRFMQRLATAYAMYFNLKYKHSGTIFESKFKARHANEDKYLEYLFAYIHLNPVEHIEPEWKNIGIKNLRKTEKYLQGYNFSSYPDYTQGEGRAENKIISHEAFPKYFSSVKDVKEFHNIWLNFEKSDHPDTF